MNSQSISSAQRSIKQILVLGYVWPEPNSSAAGRHMLSILELFTLQGWQVTFASPSVPTEHKIDLTKLNIQECHVQLNCSSFDRFIVELNPDLVLFDRFMLEEQFGWRVAKHCPDALRIIDTEDLHFVRDARHTAVKQSQSAEQANFDTDLAKREIAAIFRSDISLIISAFEYNLLNTEFSVPSSILHHCPFMLPQADSTNTDLSYSQRQHFISIGNFRHAPNWDAVLQLKHSLWPKIRQQCKHAELHIYGAYPPPKATQLHNSAQGFLVKGWAADAHAVMKNARVCLAPLRFGAGLKGKLIEAAQCKTPSITTSIGCEGMGDPQQWPGAVTHSDEEFIEQAVAHYENQTSWDAASVNAQLMLENNFKPRPIQAALINKIHTVFAHLEQHRRANFIGSMLQHHTMKSTQYMAQWIEAKNSVSSSAT